MLVGLPPKRDRNFDWRVCSVSVCHTGPLCSPGTARPQTPHPQEIQAREGCQQCECSTPVTMCVVCFCFRLFYVRLQESATDSLFMYNAGPKYQDVGHVVYLRVPGAEGHIAQICDARSSSTLSCMDSRDDQSGFNVFAHIAACGRRCCEWLGVSLKWCEQVCLPFITDRLCMCVCLDVTQTVLACVLNC